MKKQILAAVFAALVVTGVASADYIRRLEAYSIKANEITVAGTVTATAFSGPITGEAETAAALAANGANCSAGSAPLGVDEAGAAESCTDYEEDLSNSAGLRSALSDETGTGVAVFGTAPVLSNVKYDIPATQVVAATDTITADACGSVKLISSAGAVTTNTTDTFTAPAAGNEGCYMFVCNVNASDAITLDNNALFESQGAADVVLAGKECVGVVSTGASGVWIQVSSKHANHA